MAQAEGPKRSRTTKATKAAPPRKAAEKAPADTPAKEPETPSSIAQASWELLTKPQRKAFSMFNDSLGALREMSSSPPKPEEVLRQVTSLASAMGDLAGTTVLPLEYLVSGQRQLAETLAAYALLQRQLADVVETAAANQAAIVQTLELMTGPVVGTAQRMRSEKKV